MIIRGRPGTRCTRGSGRRLRGGWIALLAPLALGATSPAQLSPLHLTTLDGVQLDLAATQHEVVVVHFWATWCLPCRVEMPILDRMYHAYHARGLDMVGVALDTGASRGKVGRVAMGVTFPLARVDDTNVKRRDLPRALPETLVYGRDGTLRYRFHAGGTMLDEATLAKIIPPLLDER